VKIADQMPKKDYFAVLTTLPDRQTQVIWILSFAGVCKAKETKLAHYKGTENNVCGNSA
jgi:hypothetical protein